MTENYYGQGFNGSTTWLAGDAWSYAHRQPRRESIVTTMLLEKSCLAGTFVRSVPPADNICFG